MKWYKRDPNAFSDGVACLTLEEVGAYCLILEAWYARDGELRDDDWLLSRILRCDIRRVRRLKNTLISRGKIWVDRGKIEAKSARLRLEEARKYSASQAEVANKRWKKVSKNKDAPHADMALPPQPQPQPHIKKEGTSYLPKKRAKTVFPENWTPEDLLLGERGEFDHFADHARSVGRLCANWNAAWRNWKRKGEQMRKENPNGTSQVQPNKSALAALAEIRRGLARGAGGNTVVGLPAGRLRGPDEIRDPVGNGAGKIFEGSGGACDQPDNGAAAPVQISAFPGRSRGSL